MNAGASRGGVAAALLALLVLLAGCAAPPRVQPPPGCALDYSGRLAVVEQGAGARNLYGSFELRLDGDSGWLEIGSPLGQMLARARWSAASASVDDGHRRRVYPTFEDMTEASVGLRLPRAALQDWVRGRAAAGWPSRELAGGGFEQLGWQVRMQLRDGTPHILRLRRESDGGSEALSLVIDRLRQVGADCPTAGRGR